MERIDRLIRKVVEIAVAMFRINEFSSDITLWVFRLAMLDPTFVADYTIHIGGMDQYMQMNSPKEVNLELDLPIKNAMPVEVVKGPGINDLLSQRTLFC